MSDNKLKIDTQNVDKLLVQKIKSLFDISVDIPETEFDLLHYQMLDLYVSRIDIHNPENREVVIYKKDLERILGVSKINKSVLVSALKLLMAPVEIQDPENPKATIITHLFDRAIMDKEGRNSAIKLIGSQDASKYFFNIDNIGYIKYRIENVLKLKSIYSYKLYTYIEKNRFRNSWSVTLDEFMKYMFSGDIPKSYTEYYQFNEKILKQAKKDIETKTTTKINYQKKGEEILFTIESLTAIGTTVDEDEKINDLPTVDEDEKINDLPNEVLWYSALFQNDRCEFSKNELELLNQILVTVPATKLPQDNVTGLDDIDIRRYHYMALMYAKLNKAEENAKMSSGKGIKNRFNYLKAMIEKDAGL